ncbi:MAG: phosphoribosylaminoimidazolesuccinocarboxamide synthase [Ruminococcus sp.]|jgi:phosphoribosylaminoimidazole-succinocarboxamide synthase|nr:phosphoribosylaminoimidazolesuccinocarboxamide synthase [Ruminococcus sp.]
MNITKETQLYEGKAKRVYATSDPDLVIVDYKDDATAFNGEKKGTITGKGVINNKLTNHLMKMLEEKGIPTHFIEEISDREAIVKKVTIIPLEVIIRNIAAGSFSKRFGVEEGKELLSPTLEFSYKDDALGDPMINTYHIKALGIATTEELKTLADMSFKINEILKDYLIKDGIILVDFKLEFGKTSSGQIVLADEISPDTCRFWDSVTKEKLDKDRFRRSLGGEVEAYEEISKRVLG